MTAQIPDRFIFENEDYDLIGLSGGDLIIPQDYGMESEMIHTACYRGFYSTYEITGGTLTLKEMNVYVKDGQYKPINGIEPVIKEGMALYSGIGLKVPFTGKLRLAKDFIQEFYIHMGFQKPTAYETVIDFTINEGTVEKVDNRSEEIAKKRGEFKRKYEDDPNIVDKIDDAFSLDMDLE